MKILHVVAAGTLRGGTEKFMVRLLPVLKAAGIEQLVITKSDHTELKDHIESLGIPVVAASQHKRNPWSIFTIWRAFRKFQPDIAMSWLPRAAQRIPKGPWLQVAQVTWHQDMHCYGTTDVLFVPSPGLQEHMKQYTQKPIYVLPHFTDHADGATKLLPRQTTPPMVLGLGRFDHNKGFDVLVAAMAHVQNAELWLVGEGEEEQALRTQAQALGIIERVKFFPWAADIAPFLAQASCLVVPSRQEALGLVILEAWHQHVPVVASDVDGPRYLLGQDEAGIEAGILVPKEDPKALAKAIHHVLQDADVVQKLCAAGQRRLQSAFTAEATQKAYVKTLNALFS